MRCRPSVLILTLCGLIAATTSFACGGAAIPDPPADAKPGPPPGTTPEMIKTEKDTKKR